MKVPKSKKMFPAFRIFLGAVMCTFIAGNVRSSEKHDATLSQKELELRIRKIEEKLKGFETEIKTKKVVAKSAVFENKEIDIFKNSRVEISESGVRVIEGDIDADTGEAVIAILQANRLVLENLAAYTSAPSWANGKGINLEIGYGSPFRSPEIRMWHQDSSLGIALDRKLSQISVPRNEVKLSIQTIGKREGFYILDGNYGPILIQPTELKEFGTEGVLTLKIASASALVLSGIKGKVRFQKDMNSSDSSERSDARVSFVLNKRMDSGIYFQVDVPLGVSKSRVGSWLIVSDIEVLGVFVE
jgi:hypothetical protein